MRTWLIKIYGYYLLMESFGGMQHQKQHSGGTLGVSTPTCDECECW
jgi:hypothetical protein